MKRLVLLSFLFSPLSLWANAYHSSLVAQLVINQSAPNYDEQHHGKATTLVPRYHRPDQRILIVPGGPRYHGHNYEVPTTPRLPSYGKKVNPPRRKNHAQLNTHGHD